MSKRLALYFGILLALYLVLVLLTVQRPLDNDFSILYGSAQLYWEGKSLYAPVEIERFHQWDSDLGPHYPHLLPNLNPPFLTLLMLPLTGFRYSTAFWIWSLLSLLAGMAAMAHLEAETRRGPASAVRQMGFQLLLLAYYPTWINIQYGQVALFLFLPIVLAWSRLRRERWVQGGLLLGLALALKIFVGLFVLYLLLRRRLGAAVAMGSSFLVCWAASVAVFGWEALEEYRAVLTLITWSAASWNASFQGFFTRLFGGSENLPLVYWPELGRSLAALCSIGWAVLLVWAGWANEPAGRRQPAAPPPSRWDLLFGLTAVSMLLLSPLGWAYYFSILLLPMVLLWYAAETLAWRRACRALLVFSGLLSATPFPLLDAVEIQTNLDRFVYAGVYSYALMLLGGLLLAAVWQNPTAASE